MRSKNLFLLLLLCSINLFSQEKEQRHEVGFTVWTISSANALDRFFLYTPTVEYFNGVFYRYHFKEVTLRAQASYFSSKRNFEPDNNCFDCQSIHEKNKIFRIGLGLQWSPFEKRKALYSFVDMTYRYYHATGTVSGGFFPVFYTFNDKQNGLETFLGLGWKVKTIPRLNLSPEVSLVPNYFRYVNTQTSMNAKFAPEIGTDLRMFLFVRVHLTVAI
jgi:hypothetical protein